MQTKILKVYYGDDRLPYKDLECSVHYPIVGNAFQNANNTTHIYFYFDKIGGINTTWVALMKLPSGKIGCQVLTKSSDEDGNYAILSVNKFMTQYIGNVFVSLQGYEGDIELIYDDETDTYALPDETPTIQSTGAVKLMVEYSTGIIGSEDFDTITLQTLLAYCEGKLNIEDGIVVESNLFSADVSGFDINQIFFDKTTNALYKFDAERHLILYGNQDGVLGREHLVPRYSVGTNPNTGETFNPQLASLNGITFIFVARYSGTDYLCHFQSGRYRAISLKDLTSYYSEDGSLYFSTLIVDANKDDIIHDSNLDTKIYPYFNAISMTSGSKVLNDAEIELITNNPNTKIYYNGIWYDRDRVNTSSQPVFINYDFAASSGDLNITTRAVIYNTTNHTLNAGSTQLTTLTKAKINSTFAHSVETTLNTTNYVMTTKLKDADGNVISTDTVDLPLESVVVSGSYDDATESIVLVLQSGQTISIPVGDLVDGLVSTTYLTNNYYNKTGTDNLLNAKADKSTTYTKTETDNLLNAKANNNAVVHLTGNETIAGVKTFTDGVSFSGSYIYALARFMSNVSPYSSNSYDLGTSSYYWKDLYLKSKITDGTYNFTVEDYNNFKAEVNKKLAELFEAVIEEKTASFTYLQWSTLPNNIDGQPIIYSGGSEMTNVKGNSAVVNQLQGEVNSTNMKYLNSVMSVSSGVCSFTASQQNGLVYQDTPVDLVLGHKYLFYAQIKTTTATTSVNFVLQSAATLNQACASSTSWQVVTYIGLAAQSSMCRMMIRDTRESDWDEVQVRCMQVFDLTIMGLDTLTTVDQVRSALLERGINIDEYNAYNEGSIKNSKPTSLVVKHFNLCDEIFEGGSISNTTGENTDGSNNFRTTNYIEVPYNASLYVKCALDSAGLYLFYYDGNHNFISRSGLFYSGVINIPNNTRYVRLMAYKSGSGWGSNVPSVNEAQVIINLSNATLNGTYRPYIAPTEYALDLPILRGVGTAQDDKEKVMVGHLTFDGTESWNKASSQTTAGMYRFYRKIDGMKSGNYVLGLCSKYPVFYTSYNNQTEESVCFGLSNDNIQFLSATDRTTNEVAALFNGVEIEFELAAPTDQTAITLPDDIAIADGDSFEITYDSTDNCGADFDFAVATNKVI